MALAAAVAVYTVCNSQTEDTGSQSNAKHEDPARHLCQHSIIVAAGTVEPPVASPAVFSNPHTGTKVKSILFKLCKINTVVLLL